MDSLDRFFVAFNVPPGTREIEIARDAHPDDNTLDWGLVDPQGVFRGWGGGRGLDGVPSPATTPLAPRLLRRRRARPPDRLFVPGRELTTYAGDMNAIGATARSTTSSASPPRARSSRSMERTCPSSHVFSNTTRTCPFDHPSAHTARST
ncbi:hypothetical protein [Nannocystis pusilla]|uniref:hypothetical protein n=1 Tax=Nannocystis pusilla TaxID=889268 RepID=UPI003DA27413